jgi:hypothetical protein
MRPAGRPAQAAATPPAPHEVAGRDRADSPPPPPPAVARRDGPAGAPRARAHAAGAAAPAAASAASAAASAAAAASAQGDSASAFAPAAAAPPPPPPPAGGSSRNFTGWWGRAGLGAAPVGLGGGGASPGSAAAAGGVQTLGSLAGGWWGLRKVCGVNRTVGRQLQRTSGQARGAARRPARPSPPTPRAPARDQAEAVVRHFVVALPLARAEARPRGRRDPRKHVGHRLAGGQGGWGRGHLLQGPHCRKLSLGLRSQPSRAPTRWSKARLTAVKPLPRPLTAASSSLSRRSSTVRAVFAASAAPSAAAPPRPRPHCARQAAGPGSCCSTWERGRRGGEEERGRAGVCVSISVWHACSSLPHESLFPGTGAVATAGSARAPPARPRPPG